MWFFPLLAIFRVSLKYLVLGIWSFDLYDLKKRSTVMESLSSIFKKGWKESLSKNKWFARRNAFFVVFVKIDCDRIDPVDLWKWLTVIESIPSIIINIDYFHVFHNRIDLSITKKQSKNRWSNSQPWKYPTVKFSIICTSTFLSIIICIADILIHNHLYCRHFYEL